MLIRRLRVSGLLSFGPRGVDLPMEPLNVLIGPNGSGKSNLLEVIGLLRSVAKDPEELFGRREDACDWLWKGGDSAAAATVEAIVDGPDGAGRLRHTMTVADDGGCLGVAVEEVRETKAGEWSSERRGDAALRLLREQYEGIRLYQNWSVGPWAALRRNQGTHAASDSLNDGGENLAVVLAGFRGEAKRRLVGALGELADGIVDVSCPMTGGAATLCLEERGGRRIPATRLSDGALRYLSLLAILLHPAPPPLVALDQPELGLHPDVVGAVAGLLVGASERTQIVVTTHSRMLVDALTDRPSSVVVCEKENGESRFERSGWHEIEGMARQVQPRRAVELRRAGGQSLVTSEAAEIEFMEGRQTPRHRRTRPSRDPDEGLALREDFAQQLERSLADGADGRTTSLADVAERIESSRMTDP